MFDGSPSSAIRWFYWNQLPNGYFEWVNDSVASILEKNTLSSLVYPPRWVAFRPEITHGRVFMSVLVRDRVTLVWCSLVRRTEVTSLAVLAGGIGAALSDQVRQEMAMSFVRRKNVESSLQSQCWAVPAEGQAKKLPALMEHLCRCVHEGTEEVRVPSSLTVFAEGGVFKVFCNSKDTGESLCVSAPSWEGLWVALEKALVDPQANWRPSGNGRAAKPPKRS